MRAVVTFSSVRLTAMVLFIAAGIFPAQNGFAFPGNGSTVDPSPSSTREEAIRFIREVKEIKASSAWPNIKPELFMQNLRNDVEEPMSLYQGSGTNFCGYAAFTYLFIKDDPLGYAKLILQLYTEGKASFNKTEFIPSEAIRKEAGRLRYKGILDIHPADQLWFLTLADHYKGYLNLFNRRYDPGDENSFWASVNYAKFNRMIRKLTNYRVNAIGSDLVRTKLDDTYGYIVQHLADGPVILFINNRIVHKKIHGRIKFDVPTHFIVVQQIETGPEGITLVYWDYGGRSLIQLSPEFLKKIVFGITCCTKPRPL